MLKTIGTLRRRIRPSSRRDIVAFRREVLRGVLELAGSDLVRDIYGDSD